MSITHRIRNFYGCLNNILSVLGKGKNEITAVHLVRTYCIPILTYGSAIWHITESEKCSLNVLSERYSTAAGGKAPSVYSSIQGVFPCISL